MESWSLRVVRISHQSHYLDNSVAVVVIDATAAPAVGLKGGNRPLKPDRAVTRIPVTIPLQVTAGPQVEVTQPQPLIFRVGGTRVASEQGEASDQREAPPPRLQSLVILISQPPRLRWDTRYRDPDSGKMWK